MPRFIRLLNASRVKGRIFVFVSLSGLDLRACLMVKP
jgi:hypothetical protein